MSRSPSAASGLPEQSDYGTSWAAIMQLARSGNSWSGRERSCGYLNTRDGRFADVSFVSGLDSPADGRAFAAVDWDRDGDLDLWFRDRTAPRLRLLRNSSRRSGGGGSFVALRLEGGSANRDAIGATAEIVPDGVTPTSGALRLRRSVRAGDLFLSQSSKWLHFGLAGVDAATNDWVADVVWPGGAKERFTGITSSGRFVLKQGAGEAIDAGVPEAIIDTSSNFTLTAPATTSARVVLPVRVPFPIPVSTGAESAPVKARLLVLWSRNCAHCVKELLQLSVAAEMFRAQGVDILLLSVDAADRASSQEEAKQSLEWVRTRVPRLTTGFVDAAALGLLRVFEHALLDVEVEASVPRTYLLDGEGGLLSMYRGAVSAKQLSADTKSLTSADSETRHHLATPFGGSWMTRPVPEADVAEFVARRLEERFPEEALRYFEAAFRGATGKRKDRLASDLVARCLRFAASHREARDPEAAAYFFDLALRIKPSSAPIHADFAALFATFGALEKAEEHFARALELDSALEAARRGLEAVRKLRAESPK